METKSHVLFGREILKNYCEFSLYGIVPRPDFKDLLFLDSQILKTEAFEIIEDGLVI